MQGKSRSSTVFVGNIPYGAEEEELRNIFSRAGPVDNFRLVFDKDTKQPKGYGFCDYQDPDTAAAAIRNLNEVEFNGRRLRVDVTDNALRNKDVKVPGSSNGPPSQHQSTQLALPAPPLPAAPVAIPATVVGGTAAGTAAGVPLPANVSPNAPITGPGSLPGFRNGADADQKAPQDILNEVSCHTEIAQIVSGLPEAQLKLCLGTMQRLAIEAPESARALLQEHPQLCYALLHSQLMLGLNIDPVGPPSVQEINALRAQAAARPMALPNIASMIGAGAQSFQANPLLVLAGLQQGRAMAGLVPGATAMPCAGVGMPGMLPTGFGGLAPPPPAVAPGVGLLPKCSPPAPPAPPPPAMTQVQIV